MKNLATPLELVGFGSHSETDRRRDQFFDWRVVAIALFVFAGYFLGAKIGFALTFRPHPVSVLWPPNSILLAALLLTPVRIWWVVLLAAFPAHLAVQLQSGVPPTMIFCWFVSNSCEALIGAGCIRYLIDRPVRLDRLRNVGIFCFFAAFLGPFLSSFLDSAFVVFNHWGQGSYWEIWRIRFTSNVLAALSLAPLIVTWSSDGIAWLAKISRWRFLEASLVFLGLLSVNVLVFYQLTPAAGSTLLYLPLPLLLWIAVRFGPRGASAAICTVGFLAIWSAGHGYGPFSTGSAEENALSIQMFLIVMSVPLLFLASVIEERGKGEATLREREERIRLAAESANLALWVYDPEKNVAWMSEKGRAIYGFGSEELLSRDSLVTCVHPDERQVVRNAFDRARASSETFEIEHRILKPGGKTGWVMTRGRCLCDEQGKLLKLIGVTIDVTAKKQVDLQLQLHRQEIAHLSRVAVMGEMAASIAHELNQPLSGIISNARAGERFIDRGHVDLGELRDLLTDIVADGRRAGDVIRGIQSMVKKGTPVRQRVNLNDLVVNVVRMVNPDAVLHSCELQTLLEPNLPAIEADPIQLQQVLINLVINAFDAMRDTPLDRRRVVIATDRNGDGAICASVRDYGVGISEEARERLFEHFFTTKAEGLGMGLGIVRSIVESHAGTVAGENVAGGGAQFHFTLPASTAAS
jgi:two-component system, LuxR family, sensor kinase FixL